MPNINDEYQSHWSTIMPYFVFEAVIEYHHLALVPRPVIEQKSSVRSEFPKLLPSKSTNLVSVATRNDVFGGTFSPRCVRRRQFVGPQWGQTCVAGCMTLNFTWPRLQNLAAGNVSINLHVNDARSQFLLFFWPRVNSSNCFQSPKSRRFSASLIK